MHSCKPWPIMSCINSACVSATTLYPILQIQYALINAVNCAWASLLRAATVFCVTTLFAPKGA